MKNFTLIKIVEIDLQEAIGEVLKASMELHKIQELKDSYEATKDTHIQFSQVAIPSWEAKNPRPEDIPFSEEDNDFTRLCNEWEVWLNNRNAFLAEFSPEGFTEDDNLTAVTFKIVEVDMI